MQTKSGLYLKYKKHTNKQTHKTSKTSKKSKIQKTNKNIENKAMSNLLSRLTYLVKNRQLIIDQIRKSVVKNTIKNRTLNAKNKIDPLGKAKIIYAKSVLSPNAYKKPINKGKIRAIKSKYYSFINKPGTRGTVSQARAKYNS